MHKAEIILMNQNDSFFTFRFITPLFLSLSHLLSYWGNRSTEKQIERNENDILWQESFTSARPKLGH